MASEGQQQQGGKGDEGGGERQADQRHDQQIDRQTERGNAMEIDGHGERHRQLDQRRDQQQLEDAQSETDESRGQGPGKPVGPGTVAGGWRSAAG